MMVDFLLIFSIHKKVLPHYTKNPDKKTYISHIRHFNARIPVFSSIMPKQTDPSES